MAIVTVTLVFVRERTMRTIGLSTDGIIKSLVIGLLVGLAECMFWGNLNPGPEVMYVSDIESGEVILMAPLFEEVFFQGISLQIFSAEGLQCFQVYCSDQPDMDHNSFIQLQCFSNDLCLRLASWIHKAQNKLDHCTDYHA